MPVRLSEFSRRDMDVVILMALHGFGYSGDIAQGVVNDLEITHDDVSKVVRKMSEYVDKMFPDEG